MTSIPVTHCSGTLPWSDWKMQTQQTAYPDAAVTRMMVHCLSEVEHMSLAVSP